MKKILLGIFLVYSIVFANRSLTIKETEKKDDIVYSKIDNSPYTGIVEEKNSDGNLLYKMLFLQGKPIGEATIHYTNGNILSKRNFNMDGKLDGYSFTYGPDGEVTEISLYKNGEKINSF